MANVSIHTHKIQTAHLTYSVWRWSDAQGRGYDFISESRSTLMQSMDISFTSVATLRLVGLLSGVQRTVRMSTLEANSSFTVQCATIQQIMWCTHSTGDLDQHSHMIKIVNCMFKQLIEWCTASIKKGFPSQVRDVVSPTCSSLRNARNTSQGNRCLGHFSWFRWV